MPETQYETTLSEEPSTSQIFDPETFLFNPRPYAREKSTQTSKKLGKRSVKTQTALTTTSTFFHVKSVLPPAQPFDATETAYDVAADQETEETEVDTKSSTSEESATGHSEFVQVEALSTESEAEESCDDLDPDWDPERRTILQMKKSPQDQIKFIVFEEAILEIFSKCGRCGSECIVTMENQIGSLCTICSRCTTGEHYFEWTTGPSLFKMPAFHLLFASSILATGMESSKVIRLFNALGIPNVKQRELSDILKNYAIPAVYKVWQEVQSASLQEIEDEPIVIASDMRVDSPGHTGLFGSGSTLDMKRNIILDTQVIKVNTIFLLFIS